MSGALKKIALQQLIWPLTAVCCGSPPLLVVAVQGTQAYGTQQQQLQVLHISAQPL